MTSLEQLIVVSPQTRRRGQILVVVAVAMIGLLVTAGLATDTGIILMRKAQFDRAIDAAALAGAPVADMSATPSGAADARGMQILQANGIGLDPTKIGCQGTQPTTVPLNLTSTSQYCGSAFPGNLPGTTDYHVNARWTIPLAFMSIFGGPFSGSRTGGVASVTLYSGAEASYYDTVDVYTLGNDQGLLQSSNLELFGPNTCINNGDAFSPLYYANTGNSSPEIANPYRTDINPAGQYTYRIAVPDSYNSDLAHNLVRVELYDPQTANLGATGANGKMSLVTDANFNSLEGTNQTYAPTTVENPGMATVTNSCSALGVNGQDSPCLIPNGQNDSQGNPLFWYVKMDEIRSNCGSSGYRAQDTDRVQFRLYYYKQLPSGQLVKTYLAQYTGKDINTSTADTQEAYSTALEWVAPVQNNSVAGDVPTPSGEEMPSYSCMDINNLDGQAGTLNRCTGTQPYVSSPKEPRVQVDPIPCSPAYQAKYGQLCPNGSPANATYSPYSNGDFIINTGGADVTDPGTHTQVYQSGLETDGIYEDPSTQTKYIYLEVQSMTGSSENNWGVWAGPALEEGSDKGDYATRFAPSFINARQVYLYALQAQGQNYHTSHGVVAYGVGHLPYNSDTSARTRFPIANIGPELAGAQMTIKLFDADAGTYPPVMFYYDTIPTKDWSVCFEDKDGSANDPSKHSPSTTCAAEGAVAWNSFPQSPKTVGTPVNGSGQHLFGVACGWNYSCGQWAPFQFTNPTDSDKNNTHPIPFYGGRLFVDYQGGNNDTFGWSITVQARPALVN